VNAERPADRGHQLLQRVTGAGLRGEQRGRWVDDRLQLRVHVGPVPRWTHAELLGGGDDAFSALQARQVVAQLRCLAAQLLVLIRESRGLVRGLRGMGTLADIRNPDAGERRDQRQQGQRRAWTTAAKTGATCGCFVERDTRQVIGGKLGT